jgi:DNA primase
LSGAPVSVPITWDELGSIKNGDINITNLWERLARFGDLWAPVSKGGQRIEQAEKALGIGPPPAE